MTDEFWIVRDDIGIKCFPRVASTTILNTYGYGQSCVRWMTAKARFIVVRDPYSRLLSAYALFQDRRYTDIPKVPNLNTLLEYIVNTPDEDRDVHVRSMTAQLQGYKPIMGELVEMEYFLANPPMKIPPPQLLVHRNQTGKRPDTGEIDQTLFNEYTKQYASDMALWHLSTK